MKKITFLLLSAVMLTLSWQGIAQSTINITTSGGSFASEKWVSITTEVDGGGTQVWGQGDGTQCNGNGLINQDIMLAPGTYYVNCYDTYDDGWDGTLITVTAYGSVIGDNGGLSPDDGMDTDSSFTCEGTAEELEASFQIVVPTAPTDTLDYYNLQWPGSGTITNGDGFNVYAQCWEDGLTNASATPAAGIEAWIGYSSADTDPSGTGWTWVAATANPGYDFNADNDEFLLDLDAEVGPGVYYFASRWRLNAASYTYGGFDAGLGGADGDWDGIEDISGMLTVNAAPGEDCINPLSLTVETDCSTATPYTMDYSTAYDLGTTALSCDTAGVNTGLWFEFTAPASGGVTVNTSDSNEILVIDACGGTEVVCNSTTATSHVVSGLTAAAVYKLAIWKDSATTGTTDICIEEITCPDPSGMTASGVTSTTADLVWVAGGSETDWNIEYSDADFTAGTGAAGVIADTATGTPIYNATGLMANTTYYVYYQSNCGGDASSWIGPFIGTTLCDAFVPDYTADMSNNPVDSCWNEADSGDPSTGPADLGAGLWYASNHGGTPSNAINLYFNTRSDWIISPEFDLSTSAPSELKVYVALTESSTSGSGADLGSDDEVRLVMTADSGTTWTTLQSWVQGSVPTDVGEEIIYDLSAQTGTVQFAFWGSDGAVNDLEDIYFHVSGFTVRETPSCVEPSDLDAISVMTTSVELAWTENGTATAWNFEWKAGADFTPGNGEEDGSVNATTNPYTITGLTPATTYYVYYQADCGGDTSPWVGPVSGPTDCEAVSTFPWTEDFESVTTPDLPVCWQPVDDNGDDDIFKTYTTYGVSGSQAVGLYTDFNSGANNDYLILPQFTLTGNERLRYNVRTRNTSEPDEYKVILSTATDNTADFTTELLPLTSVASTAYTEVEIDLSAYSGNVFIALHVPATTTDGYYIYFDDFTVEEIPACDTPLSLASANITTDSVDFTWAAGASGETAWEYALVAGGSGEPVSGTATATASYSASSLTPSADYDFYVRADCGGTYSSWIFVSVTMDDPPPACGGNFYDTGGATVDYSTSEDYTVTICPDTPGDAVSVEFTFFSSENNGSTGCWDGLYIYDGSDTAATQISAPNGTSGQWCWDRDDTTPSGTGDLQGMTITSTDASGCLTFRFTSDSTVTREGWEANVTCSPLSLEEFAQYDFKYFPNPVNDNLSLRAQQNIQNVSVLNMLGQEVLRVAPNSISSEVDMSALNAGAYFVKVTINDTTETIKIIRK